MEACSREKRGGCKERKTLKWWMSDSMLSFIEARGGGTSL